ncbi:MAG: hypothetical protein AB8E82_19215 [Aureispira sp.]
MSNKNNKSAYLQGFTRLITEATIGVTDLTEAMHKRVVHPPFLPSTPVQHLITNIASITYKSIRWSTRLIGGSLDMVLGQLAPVLGTMKPTDEKEAIQAALNGVVGDYLEAKENPLQISMQFRLFAKAVPLDRKRMEEIYPTINGKILLMVHGLCMNDIQWTRKGHNHGVALAKDLGKTPIYLHYNSGRHISSNGQSLNELLENLVLHWPVPIEELVIVAHSMGGWCPEVPCIMVLNSKKHGPNILRKLFFWERPTTVRHWSESVII